MNFKDMLDGAKGAVGDLIPGSDERIDAIAEAIEDKTPDQLDSVVETVADFAKDHNKD